VRVKNNTQYQEIYCGQLIIPSSTYDIQPNELHIWKSTDSVVVALSNGNLLISDGSENYKSQGAEAVQYLMGVDTAPKDPAGRPIQRMAATIEGWHYQLLSVEIETAKSGGFYCKDEAGNDLGFVTYKMLDSNGNETQVENDCVKTRVWIRPTHNYEVIGAIFGQAEVPTEDVRLFVVGLPGVANVNFSTGGINLRYCGLGTYQLANGRASKYLGYVHQVPDANSFLFSASHNSGFKHKFQVTLEIYKAP
jgi:hypothetical protein